MFRNGGAKLAIIHFKHLGSNSKTANIVWKIVSSPLSQVEAENLEQIYFFDDFAFNVYSLATPGVH